MRVQTALGEWRQALETLAAVEPTGQVPLAALLVDDSGPAARAFELDRLSPRASTRALVDRVVHRSLAQRRVSVVYVDAPTFAGRPPVARARPAQAAGLGCPRRRRAPRRRPPVRARDGDEAGGARGVGPRPSACSRLVVMGWSWLRLEHGEVTWGLLFWVFVVGIAARPASAAAPAARRGPGSGARSGSTTRSGPPGPDEAWQRIVDGFYLYYDVPLPFGAAGHPLMHGIVVLAVLGFTLAISLAVAERRALLATGAARRGRGLAGDAAHELEHGLGRGAVILVAALVLLGALSSAASVRQLSVAAAVVVAAAGLVSTMPRGREGRVPRLGDLGARRARTTSRSASATCGTRTTPRSSGPSAGRRC